VDLYSIAGGVISSVNPMLPALLTASTGYTTGPDGSQVETYATPVNQMIQIQDLSTQELIHLSSLNIQGNLQKVYMQGQWNGVVRPRGEGGDLLTYNGQNWLITHVLEQWSTWTCVVVELQL
jgi:hypothetical protein